MLASKVRLAQCAQQASSTRRCLLRQAIGLWDLNPNRHFPRTTSLQLQRVSALVIRQGVALGVVGVIELVTPEVRQQRQPEGYH